MFFKSLNISASGMTAQRARLDIISENIANSQTTRTENGEPFKRKMVVLEAIGGNSDTPTFRDRLGYEMNLRTNRTTYSNVPGVRVKEIVEDERDAKLVYDPSHPHADENGYVEMSNVDLLKEMVDSMSASRAYAANVTAFNAMKNIATNALTIGK